MVALRMRSLFLPSCLILLHIGSTARVASELVFDSIYQFGDSLSDTGNSVRLSPSSICDRSPYGETFFKKPAGRCSDGLLMVDFFARALNLSLLNPYLQKDADFSHGVNFAVAGATALNSSAISSKVALSGLPIPTSDNSLSVQLQWFRTHLASACPSSSDCKMKFRRTLFLLGEVGGNDYNFPLSFGKSIKDCEKLIPDVVQTISNAVKEVIDHGAVQVVVPGNFPIGCLPMYLTTFGSDNSSMYDDLGCLRALNEFTKLHNDQLQQSIKALQKEYPNVSIHYGDYYSSFTWILKNAASLGFDKDAVFKPCCGDMNHVCGLKGTSVCSDPKKRISWDGIHLTQEMYRNLAQWLMSNTFAQAIPCCSDSQSSASGADVTLVVLLRVVAVSVLASWAIGSKLL